MSETLKINCKQRKIAILDLKNPNQRVFKYNKETQIQCDNGLITPCCINCNNPQCQFLSLKQLSCSSLSTISQDTNLDVCPVGAIKSGLDSISIDETKCIGCGLCVTRCPVGAISMQNGKATLNNKNKSILKELPATSSNIEKQNKFLDELKKIVSIGCICDEENKSMSLMYEKIGDLSQPEQNRLARNLLISIGANSSLARQGNVYARMDGIYETEIQYGIIEIETGPEMLDVSRALLDDIAVMHSRYNISKNTNRPLAICLMLPNKRTDYWRVVKDISNVVNIHINTITFGALLIYLWNLKKVKNFDVFYIDIDKSSLRETVETQIGRKINIPLGYLGILEPSK